MRTNALAALLWLTTLVLLACGLAEFGTGYGLFLLVTAAVALLAAVSAQNHPGSAR